MQSEATAASYDCGCEFEFVRNYPPTINHEAETDFARDVLGEVVGPANVLLFDPQGVVVAASSGWKLSAR